MCAPKDLAQRAGGHFAVETVDADALVFMLLTPWAGRTSFLVWEEEGG